MRDPSVTKLKILINFFFSLIFGRYYDLPNSRTTSTSSYKINRTRFLLSEDTRNLLKTFKLFRPGLKLQYQHYQERCNDFVLQIY